MLQESSCLIFPMREIEILKKHACQNMVAMETSSHGLNGVKHDTAGA